MEMMTCAKCGKIVPRTGRAKKYCEDCARPDWRKPKPKTSYRIGRPRKTIEDIAKEAAALNLSYGKYIAIMEGRNNG